MKNKIKKGGEEEEDQDFICFGLYPTQEEGEE
jgi:hypothetical protein